LVGIERFTVFEPGFWIAADADDQIGEFAANDLAAEDFVVQTVVGQEVFVEEMAEGTVADVVQQRGETHERFDVSAAGHVGADFAEAVVKGGDGPGCQVHGAEDVLKSRVFGRGKNPPGRL